MARRSGSLIGYRATPSVLVGDFGDGYKYEYE